ncbi:MAG: CHRD domain-containing protein [Dehalococcoidia bacterium]
MSNTLANARIPVAAILLGAGLFALAWIAIQMVQAGAGIKDDASANLRSYNEVPAISTLGKGTFTATINPNNTISYELTYTGVEGTPQQAHIHFGQTDVNGGISAFLCGGGSKGDCPANGGTVTGTITSADVSGPAGQGIEATKLGELVRAMRAGKTYANVHSSTFPGGEIRGQIKVD